VVRARFGPGIEGLGQRQVDVCGICGELFQGAGQLFPAERFGFDGEGTEDLAASAVSGVLWADLFEELRPAAGTGLGTGLQQAGEKVGDRSGKAMRVSSRAIAARYG
jgi:hypothetical protein